MRGRIYALVAKQDEVDNLFAIWDTVTDRFLGVNLKESDAISIIMNKKDCSEEDAHSRIAHPAMFSEIAKHIMWEFETDVDKIIHFFEAEIEQCKDRILRESTCFNGVQVGVRAAEMLNQERINFCQNIIDRIRSDNL